MLNFSTSILPKTSCSSVSIKYKIFVTFSLLFNEIQNQFSKATVSVPHPPENLSFHDKHRFPEKWKTFAVKITIFILETYLVKFTNLPSA